MAPDFMVKYYLNPAESRVVRLFEEVVEKL